MAIDYSVYDNNYNQAAYQSKLMELSASRGDVPRYERKDGQNILRILPRHPNQKDFYKEYLQSWDVGPNARSVIPPGQFGLPCALTEEIERLNRVGDEASRKMALKIAPKQRISLVVVDRMLPEDQQTPMEYTVPPSVLRGILAIMASDFGDITHPLKGCDIVINYNKNANGSDKYSVMPRGRNSSPLHSSQEVMEQWLMTDWFSVWKTGEPSENEWIRACLEGRDKDFNSGTSFDPSSFSSQPATQLRKFWVYVNGAPEEVTEDALRTRFVDAGIDVPTMLVGETEWRTPAHYGIYPAPKPQVPVTPPPVIPPQPSQAPVPTAYAPAPSPAPAPQLPSEADLSQQFLSGAVSTAPSALAPPPAPAPAVSYAPAPTPPQFQQPAPSHGQSQVGADLARMLQQ